MIIKKVTYTTTELAVASGVPKDVPSRFPIYNTTEQTNRWYNPKLMYVSNGTGKNIGICPMTTLEYSIYTLSGAAFSDFFPIANSSSATFDNLKGEVTKVIVSGEAGSSNELSIYFQYQ